ncbi:MAG: orotidine-5'-phosphate decarboxylase [Candidatus Azotimanducaceae bacterium]
MQPSNSNEMTGKFFVDLANRQAALDTLLCVGLDPDLSKLPEPYLACADPILTFCKDVIDATYDLVGCFKPQFAHFAAAEALPALREVIAYCHDKNVPVILDAKRGDVGSTSSFYAREAYDVYDADAVTVNPYLGGDSLEPFLERTDKGVILLCRTSNPGGADLQNLRLASGVEVYEHIASLAAKQWNGNEQCGVGRWRDAARGAQAGQGNCWRHDAAAAGDRCARRRYCRELSGGCGRGVNRVVLTGSAIPGGR